MNTKENKFQSTLNENIDFDVTSNVFYFIALSSLIGLGYILFFSMVAILPLYLEKVGIKISKETLDALFPYLFFGGYFITLAFIIKNKIENKLYITHHCLTDKIILPFFFIFIGTIFLGIIIYLSITMKTGAASGMFFLLPMIGMLIFYGLGTVKINDIILMTNAVKREEPTKHIVLDEDKILTDIKSLKKSVSAKDFSKQNSYDFSSIINLLIAKKIDGYKEDGIWYIKI